MIYLCVREENKNWHIQNCLKFNDVQLDCPYEAPWICVCSNHVQDKVVISWDAKSNDHEKEINYSRKLELFIFPRD